MARWRGAKTRVDTWEASDCVAGNVRVRFPNDSRLRQDGTRCAWSAGTQLRWTMGNSAGDGDRGAASTRTAADWIYLDATHTYAEARDDLRRGGRSFALAAPGGHDYQFQYRGARRRVHLRGKDAVEAPAGKISGVLHERVVPAELLLPKCEPDSAAALLASRQRWRLTHSMVVQSPTPRVRWLRQWRRSLSLFCRRRQEEGGGFGTKSVPREVDREEEAERDIDEEAGDDVLLLRHFMRKLCVAKIGGRRREVPTRESRSPPSRRTARRQRLWLRVRWTSTTMTT